MRENKKKKKKKGRGTGHKRKKKIEKKYKNPGFFQSFSGISLSKGGKREKWAFRY